jgi:FHA domain-containing protein
MPQITLDVVSLDAVPLSVPRSCCFESNGGTIGRDETNALVLPDKHRRVSRLHAAVAFGAGGPNITNASTSLPISIGEIVLDCGQTMPLSSGDEVEIGPYVLRVQAIVVNDSRAAERLEDLAVAPVSVVTEVVVPYRAPVVVAPLTLEVDPFASLLAGIGSSSAGRAPPIEAVSHGGAFSQLPQEPPRAGVTEDPLAGFFKADPQPAAQPVSALTGVSMDPLAALGFGSPGDAGQYRAPPPPTARAPAAIIPQDFNPFELPSGTSRNSADPLASLLGPSTGLDPAVVSRGEPSIDSLFATPGSSNFDGLLSGAPAAPSWHAGPQSLFAGADNSDPMALFGNPSPPPEGQMRPMRDDLAEIGGAYQPPRAFEPAAPAVPAARFAAASPVAPPSAAEPAWAADQLTLAFLKGANLSPSVLPRGLTPELMAVVGSLLRTATTGAVDMLAARTATKLEVQASVTVISAQANNPLKFLPNGDVALQQLLSKKMPGFMPADEAMKDAFDDLRAHEIGVIAGTRAALAEVLGKFDPTILGQRLAGGSLLDSFLPSVRKTKLWDIYLERYSQIRREAEDDFQSIFGRAFVQAYERETMRMKAPKNKGEPGP